MQLSDTHEVDNRDINTVNDYAEWLEQLFKNAFQVACRNMKISAERERDKQRVN